MERCNFDSAVIKLLLSAAGIILTCTIVSVGIVNLNQAKQMAGMTAGKINNYNSELSQSELKIYDGLVVRGSDVINFYKKYFGSLKRSDPDLFLLTVITSLGSQTYSDGSFFDNIKSSESSCYIKPTDKFIGEVIFNDNEVITDIIFKQI